MTVAEAWNGPLGQHWAAHPERYNAMLDGFDAALFDAAAIMPGDRVVDIGCGSGLTTRMAAQRAPGGRVTGVDISAPLVVRARELTDAELFPQVTYRLGDARTCAFERGGYDLAISRGGVMFFAAMTEALLPHESPRGVMLRAGVWVVTAHTDHGVPGAGRDRAAGAP